MKNKAIVGIDVSKKILDCYLLDLQYHFQVSNTPRGFRELLEVCYMQLKVTAVCLKTYSRSSNTLHYKAVWEKVSVIDGFYSFVSYLVYLA